MHGGDGASSDYCCGCEQKACLISCGSTQVVGRAAGGVRFWAPVRQPLWGVLHMFRAFLNVGAACFGRGVEEGAWNTFGIARTYPCLFRSVWVDSGSLFNKGARVVILLCLAAYRCSDCTVPTCRPVCVQCDDHVWLRCCQVHRHSPFTRVRAPRYY